LRSPLEPAKHGSKKLSKLAISKALKFGFRANREEHFGVYPAPPGRPRSPTRSNQKRRVRLRHILDGSVSDAANLLATKTKGSVVAKVAVSKSPIDELLESAQPAPPVRVLDLMTQFENAIASHESSSINETTLRETYLNPLLEELGWDPRNRRGVAAPDKDVILEEVTSRLVV
jgi:hypothetical protein